MREKRQEKQKAKNINEFNEGPEKIAIEIKRA